MKTTHTEIAGNRCFLFEEILWVDERAKYRKIKSSKTNKPNKNKKLTNLTKKEGYMENRFTVTFGQLPPSYINREHVSEKIVDDFCLDFPLSHVYIISGVRGSGKTVLLTSVSKSIEKKKDWVVVDVNPNRKILEQIASGIYENAHVKHLFLSKTFSFSFHGFGFSIEGETPVSNVKTILEKMLGVLKNTTKNC